MLDRTIRYHRITILAHHFLALWLLAVVIFVYVIWPRALVRNVLSGG